MRATTIEKKHSTPWGSSRRRLLIIGAMSLIARVPCIAQPSTDSTSAAALPLVITSDFGNAEWVDANQPIGLRLSRPLDLETERLAVVVGRTDLSALFTVTPTVARYSAVTLPLPAGETELVAYIATPGEPWKEIARIPLRVRTRSGFRKTDVKPALTLTTNGQLAPGDDAGSSKRPPYAGVTFNPAFGTTLVHEHGTLELQSNFLAVTKQAQALRFGNQGDRAPKFDLSDYLLKSTNGPLSTSIGHVSYGSSKHLMNGVASRGLTGALAIGKAVEISAGAMNGTSIVGWDNPVGLGKHDHRIIGTSLKVDPFTAHPGTVVFDVSLLDASQLPVSNFSQGDVSDREKNRGAAFHFAGKTFGDRVTLDAGYTVSRFENPADPTLDQGAAIVAVRPETKAARFADLSVALLRNAHLSKTIPASLTATVRHERVDPLYRSLAASVQANVLQNVVELTAGLGPLAVQASHARAEDNLDDLASVLKTHTNVTSVSASLPVGALIRASKPTAWLPQLIWTWGVTHQFANDVPVNSDFTETHAPDQMSDNQSVDFQWAIGKWKAGYKWNTSGQDNRQVGREKADLDNLAHNLAAGFSPRTWLDLAATYAFEAAKNREFAQRNDTRRFGANVDLRPTSRLSLASVFSRTWTLDDPRTTESTGDDLSLELSQSFKLLRVRGDRPSARLFMRYQRQLSRSTPFENLARGETLSRETWALNSGVSVNAF